MAPRIGLGVGRSAVRAVLTHDRHVLWHAERALVAGESLGDAIVAVLRQAPLPRLRRPGVVAAIGPASAHVKRLHGLAAETPSAAASQIVRSNVSRFFLRNGIPLSATRVHRSGDAWWGAVVEQPVVDEVQRACERVGLRLETCLPALAAMAASIHDGTVQWADGDTCASLAVRDGVWVEVRRDRGTPARVSDQADAATVYADALAAVASPSRGLPLALRAGRTRDARSRRQLFRAALIALCGILALATAVAPGAAASRRLARDERRLASLDRRLLEWAPLAHDLREKTGALNELARFTSDRASIVLLLAGITRALPDSAAIVMFRIDSTSGSLTLLASNASALIPRLAEVDGVVDPRIAGAVTREIVAGAQLQRVAVKFRLSHFVGSRP